MLEERFSIPAGFNLSRYRPPDDRNLHVVVRVNLNIADKMIETVNYYLETTEERDDGLLVTFRIRQLEELLPYILSWGGDAEVLEPVSLRRRVREEAEKMFKRY
ncbi:hypothetical protein D3C73_1435890 [compost metagenome]